MAPKTQFVLTTSHFMLVIMYTVHFKLGRDAKQLVKDFCFEGLVINYPDPLCVKFDRVLETESFPGA